MAIQAQLYSDNIGFPLCGSQDLMMMDHGFNQFCFSIQQKQQPQQQQQQQYQQNFQQLQIHQNQYQNQNQNQSLCFENSKAFQYPTSKISGSDLHQSSSMSFPQSLEVQVEKHRQEVDHYITSQNERLRLLLQEQRKQQTETLLKKIELKALALLRQKDEEIAKATNKTMELEIMLKRLEMENQAWQIIAQENESMIVSLNNTLEQLREKGSCGFNNGAEDAESCCDIDEEKEEYETQEKNRANGAVSGEIEKKEDRKLMICRGCNSRESCVLFLPCRHLCSCRFCEGIFDSCPVCFTPKKASIEALI